MCAGKVAERPPALTCADLPTALWPTDECWPQAAAWLRALKHQCSALNDSWHVCTSTRHVCYAKFCLNLAGRSWGKCSRVAGRLHNTSCSRRIYGPLGSALAQAPQASIIAAEARNLLLDGAQGTHQELAADIAPLILEHPATCSCLCIVQQQGNRPCSNIWHCKV